MKYAVINGNKTEPSKGLSGICPSCKSEVIAKCGEIKIHHWAHKGNRNCDHWWENETEWHREWKGHFPIEWQEVVQFDDSGEKHIADVKTETGLVLEFQHSYIKPEERRSRIAFYPKLVWVVDGLRRVKDKSRFIKVIGEGSTKLFGRIRICFIDFPEESRILKEWGDCDVPVLFDFHEPERLWFLIPLSTKHRAYLIQISRDDFIAISKNGLFGKVADDLTTILLNYQRIIKLERQKVQRIRTNKIFHGLSKRKTSRRF